ncbi:MAG TPA: CAAX prenyl protease-related protein [Bryobacteraceae bacterium]|nr:CAAX prenyl protease-related protein [Bryobacteraceae bacterium]
MRRHPAIPYVLPFGVFIALLALQQFVAVPVWARFVVSMAAILAVSLPVLRGGPSKPLLSILIGVAVFVIWVAPDRLFPAWHHLPIFDNGIIGHPAGNTPPASKNDVLFLFFRIAISALAVPILEELFWRGWLMRWLIDSRDFRKIPLGTYAPSAFWITALLFASEHGSFWDVGLAAGIVYNWWMIRTRNIWDCIIAHAVTNAVLAWYVIGAGQWQYWL